MKRSTKRRKGLRTGYTTGACAAAAAQAAAQALLSQAKVRHVEILLPVGETVRFAVHSCSFSAASARCSIVKDAGDDPDVTHGAEIVAEVFRNKEKKIRIRGGEGVGVVTKPGLGLEIGGPAINPVPMRMIEEAVTAVLGRRTGIDVVISVPKGEALAKKTLNARLGIVGGISILGTRGTVIPYSTSAYKKCVAQSISVAAACGAKVLVLTTGGRTEKAARKIFKFREEAFVQMGDFVAYAMKEAVQAGFRKVRVVGMFGKMSKIALGFGQTHARVSKLRMDLPALWARETGMPEEMERKISRANTARHVFELMPEKFIGAYACRLCKEAAHRCREMGDGKLEVECVLVDYEGKAVAESGKIKDFFGSSNTGNSLVSTP